MDPQHHDRVGPRRDRIIKVVGCSALPGLHADGQERGGCNEGDAGTEHREKIDVGARDPRVENVADDNHVRSIESRARVRGPSPGRVVAPERHRVEQCLGGMLVGAVSRVENGKVHPAGVRESVGGSRRGVAYHNSVRSHCLQGQGGVLERFPLGDRGTSGLEVDDVGAQTLGGGLEGDARARRILEKEVDDGLTLKCGELLDAPVLCGGHLLRRVEDQNRLLARQVADRNEMAQAHRLSAFPEKDAVAPVRFVKQDGDGLLARRRQVLADVVGPDRQFPVPAIHQDRQLDRRRSADPGQRIEGGLDGAPRVEHIVDENNGLSVDPSGRYQRFLRRTKRLAGEVVSEQRGVDDRQIRVGARHLANPVNEATSKRRSSSRNARDDEALAASVAFDDLVCNTRQGARDVADSQYFFAALSAIGMQCCHC